MRIIISPAKKMNVERDSIPWRDLPCFLDRSQELRETLQRMSCEELKKLWQCNDQIAALNVQRLRELDLRTGLTPAILSYEGIQYQYMAPGVFTDLEFAYVQEHLRILSGFYGILRPFDGVIPYRLEMQAKLRMGDRKDLYEYWGGALAKEVCKDTDCIINLASKEYSICVSKHLPEGVRFISCVFGHEKDGKIIEKGTACKMARGEMVRFLAENQITDPAQIQTFDRLNYRFSPEHSNQDTCVFLQQSK